MYFTVLNNRFVLLLRAVFVYWEIPLEFPSKQKTLRVNYAQLAGKKFIASQYRSRAEIARKRNLFIFPILLLRDLRYNKEYIIF